MGEPKLESATHQTSEEQADLLGEFQIEARELLDAAVDALVTVRDNPGDAASLAEVFRSIHTIKGSAAYLGLAPIKELSHALENVLDDLRQHPQNQPSEACLQTIFRVLDCLRSVIERSAQDALTGKVEIGELLAELDSLTDIHASTAPRSEAVKSVPVKKKDELFWNTLQNQVNQLRAWVGILAKDESQALATLDTSLRALQTMRHAAEYMGLDALETSASEFHERLLAMKTEAIINRSEIFTSLDRIARDIVALSFQFTETGGVEQQTQAVVSEAKEPIARSPSESESQGGEDDPALAQVASTMRINKALLDQFMNLVGEMVVARNAFRFLEGKCLTVSDPAELSKDMHQATQQLFHITDELQRKLMAMRMVPIKTVFQKFRRTVQDLSRLTGKPLALNISGDATEIDKGLADVIAEPLLHIIRNAVDHGIESPEIRASKGKTAQGHLQLRAKRVGQSVWIEVEDDGAGIQLDKVRSKIIQKGLTSASEAQDLSDEDLLAFLFAPGFSTAETVTELSGRGVGLDAVQKRLQAVQGKIRVEHQLGKGTCFRLEFPLTMAVLDSLLVSVEEALFALPLSQVQENVRCSGSELKTAMGQKILMLRGQAIPVFELGQVLGKKQKLRLAEAALTILIVRCGERAIGFIADHILRKEEIVVKPLPACFAGVPGLAGASILGDGRTVLILEPQKLMSLIGLKQKKIMD